MSSVLQSENSALAEADELCGLIDEHADTLRQSAAHRANKLSSFTFRRLATGRNVVYRVSGRRTWFLKLAKEENTVERISCEALGAEFVRTQLAGCEGYESPDVVRVSHDNQYTLCSAIPGRQLSRLFYVASVFPFLHTKSRMLRAFRNLGECLALLHSGHVDSETPVSRRSGRQMLQMELERVTNGDEVVDVIQDAEKSFKSDFPQTWIHGNMKFENIIEREGKVGILDFETCGLGSPMDDLAGICTHLRLVQLISMFPGSAARDADDCFLKSYAAHRAFSQESLQEAIAIQFCRYFVRAYVLQIQSARIAGLRVPKAHLVREIGRMVGGSQALDHSVGN